MLARHCAPSSVARVRRLTRSLATVAQRLPDKDCTSVTPNYPRLIERAARAKKILGGRPLTLAEKILFSHLHDIEGCLEGAGRVRGEAYLRLNPARVAMQDASAQYVDCVKSLISTLISV